MIFEKPWIVEAKDLNEFKDNKHPRLVDIYQQQCQELQRIDYPTGQGSSLIDQKTPTEVWIYYPWVNVLLHCVGQQDLFRLRTNRNRELITVKEQQALSLAIVGIAGMSVGSGIAIGLSYAGISTTIKIADLDTLDTSNLNRLRESILDVGRSKTDLAAERIYELDPFAVVDIYDKGVNASTIESFFTKPKLDIIVDEIDDFKMKIQLRLDAQKNKIPLLMFTSLGDNILVDVERYDTDPDLTIFNGLLGDAKEILAKDSLSPDDIKKYSIQLVGQQYIPTRAIQSVFEMGRTLVGRPQLYSTIAVDGGLAVYVIRQILLGGGPKSGRYFVKFAELFGINSDEISVTDERQDLLSRLPAS